MKKFIKFNFLLVFTFLVICSHAQAGEYWVKEDTDEWFPVILLDDTDGKTAEVSKTFSDTTVKYATQGATSWTTYTDDTNTFKEVGDGAYWLQMGATEFSENNRYVVIVQVSGALDFRFLVNSIDNTINETVVNINDIETDTNSLDGTKIPDTISLANINAEADTALTDYDAVVPGDLPTNFSDLAITVTTGQVTVGTNNDKTGYSISGTLTTLDALDTAQDTQHGTTQSSISALNDVSTADIDARLAAIGLDHLLGASVTGTDVVDDSIIAKLVSASLTADYDDYVNTTDSLQAIRDRGDAAWATATGFSTHSAADVWTSVSRTLTELDEDNTTLDLDGTTVGGLTTWDKSGYSLSATGVDDIWDEAIAGHVGAGTFGLQLGTDVDAILVDTAEIGAAGAGLTALGDARIANLDAAVTTRMATYTQPTGFLTATFPSTVSSLTATDILSDGTALNTTAGVLDVVNLTNTVTTYTGNTPQTADHASNISAIKAVTDQFVFTVANQVDANALTSVAGDASASNQTTIINHLTDVKGGTFSGVTDSLEAIRDRGDSAWITATGFSTHNAAAVWSEATRTITGGTIDTNNDKTGYGLSATGVDDIWDELQSGHTTAGTFGKYLDTEVSGVGGGSAASIADAVLTEVVSDHSGTSGSLAEFVSGIKDNTDGDKESGNYTGIEKMIRKHGG